VVPVHRAGRAPDQAARGVGGGHHRQQDHHDERREPVCPAVGHVPPDDREQHDAQKQHHVAPVAFVGAGRLTKRPAPVGSNDRAKVRAPKLAAATASNAPPATGAEPNANPARPDIPASPPSQRPESVPSSYARSRTAAATARGGGAVSCARQVSSRSRHTGSGAHTATGAAVKMPLSGSPRFETNSQCRLLMDCRLPDFLEWQWGILVWATSRRLSA
jgi:hypothetical protein